MNDVFNVGAFCRFPLRFMASFKFSNGSGSSANFHLHRAREVRRLALGVMVRQN